MVAYSQSGAQQETSSPAVSAGFDAMYSKYSNVAKVTTGRRIFQEAYGDDYPADVEPHSHCTYTDLRRIARELQVGPGQTIVDLGCGRGGPGLWVARETGAALVGVDFSSVAVEQAGERPREFGLADRARFQVGDFCASGLPSATFDGAMSVDVLWAVPDKPAALREAWRILRPGARLVFTTWDFGRLPTDGPPQVADHRPLLRDAGFTIDAYEETPNFEVRFRALAAKCLAARAELTAEMGAEGADRLLAGQAKRLVLLPDWRRVIVVAQRPFRQSA
jgi:SAM-dependent methyltransferase